MSRNADASIFTQDFVSAITGMQNRKLPSGDIVTDINIGKDTVRIDGTMLNVLKNSFPHILSQEVPLTMHEGRSVIARWSVTPDLKILADGEEVFQYVPLARSPNI